MLSYDCLCGLRLEWKIGICIFTSREGAGRECRGSRRPPDCGLFPCLLPHPGEIQTKHFIVDPISASSKSKRSKPDLAPSQLKALKCLNINKVEMTSKGNVFEQAVGYDFHLPLMVNGARWATASPSPLSTSCSASSSLSAGSRKPVVKPLPRSVAMVTQWPQHVQATGAHGNVELGVCVLMR